MPADGAPGIPPARIVLLSDGYRTSGRSVEEAAAAAQAANVPVSTIAFGTDSGMVDIGGQLQRVPVDRLALAQLAETTQGFFYEAASVTELKQVYEDMGSSIGYRIEPREVTQWYAGVALLFALCRGGDESAVDVPAALTTAGSVVRLPRAGTATGPTRRAGLAGLARA